MTPDEIRQLRTQAGSESILAYLLFAEGSDAVLEALSDSATGTFKISQESGAAADAVARPVVYQINCPTCDDGDGAWPTPGVCPTCGGRGWLLVANEGWEITDQFDTTHGRWKFEIAWSEGE